MCARELIELYAEELHFLQSKSAQSLSIYQANQHVVSEPQDLPTANATNPTQHVRRDLLRDDISGLTGDEGDNSELS